RQTRAQPCLARARAQAAQARLPHLARAQRRRSAARVIATGARPALYHSDARRPAPRMPLPPPPGGRPPKTERPQRLAASCSDGDRPAVPPSQRAAAAVGGGDRADPPAVGPRARRCDSAAINKE